MGEPDDAQAGPLRRKLAVEMGAGQRLRTSTDPLPGAPRTALGMAWPSEHTLHYGLPDAIRAARLSIRTRAVRFTSEPGRGSPGGQTRIAPPFGMGSFEGDDDTIMQSGKESALPPGKGRTAPLGMVGYRPGFLGA